MALAKSASDQAPMPACGSGEMLGAWKVPNFVTRGGRRPVPRARRLAFRGRMAGGAAARMEQALAARSIAAALGRDRLRLQPRRARQGIGRAGQQDDGSQRNGEATRGHERSLLDAELLVAALACWRRRPRTPFEGVHVGRLGVERGLRVGHELRVGCLEFVRLLPDRGRSLGLAARLGVLGEQRAELLGVRVQRLEDVGRLGRLVGLLTLISALAARAALALFFMSCWRSAMTSVFCATAGTSGAISAAEITSPAKPIFHVGMPDSPKRPWNASREKIAEIGCMSIRRLVAASARHGKDPAAFAAAGSFDSNDRSGRSAPAAS